MNFGPSHRQTAVYPHTRKPLSVRSPVFFLGAVALSAFLLCAPVTLRAQGHPTLSINKDCQAFAISADNAIVYAVPRLKRIKKYVLERDDIFVVTAHGKNKQIVNADKFMPIPPLMGYRVDSLSWSPDGRQIAVNMTLLQPPPGFEYKSKKKKRKHNEEENARDQREKAAMRGAMGDRVVALLQKDGKEIRVAGSKSRFIEGATKATWLPGDTTVVYLTPGRNRIVRVRPADGISKTLFGGHAFQAVAWDAPRNRAFAVGEDLTVRGGLALVELNLLRNTLTPVAPLRGYDSALSVSPSGTKVAFFENGNTIEVFDLANPSKPLRVHAGLGIFQWSRDERQILLKRGPAPNSNDLVWVGLHDATFTPALHDLVYHAFQIAPDGRSVAITEPGKRVLRVYPLQ